MPFFSAIFSFPTSLTGTSSNPPIAEAHCARVLPRTRIPPSHQPTLSLPHPASREQQLPSVRLTPAHPRPPPDEATTSHRAPHYRAPPGYRRTPRQQLHLPPLRSSPSTHLAIGLYTPETPVPAAFTHMDPSELTAHYCPTCDAKQRTLLYTEEGHRRAAFCGDCFEQWKQDESEKRKSQGLVSFPRLMEVIEEQEAEEEESVQAEGSQGSSSLSKGYGSIGRVIGGVFRSRRRRDSFISDGTGSSNGGSVRGSRE